MTYFVFFLKHLIVAVNVMAPFETVILLLCMSPLNQEGLLRTSKAVFVISVIVFLASLGQFFTPEVPCDWWLVLPAACSAVNFVFMYTRFFPGIELTEPSAHTKTTEKTGTNTETNGGGERKHLRSHVNHDEIPSELLELEEERNIPNSKLTVV